MEIKLHEIGKKYGNEWIVKQVNFDFSPPNNYAILGANGSGKSTLLKVIAGFTQASKGKIVYEQEQVQIEQDILYTHLSYAAPYIDLIDDFTCLEIITFQAKFKPFLNQLSSTEVLEKSGLQNAKNKQIKHFSSGMKQRLKLTLAILANCPLLLLDEPCANLDKAAIDWYQNMIDTYASQKLKIVCSNHLNYEYLFCNKILQIEQFK